MSVVLYTLRRQVNNNRIPEKEEKDTSKDLMIFCMQLVHHSQWKKIRTFFSGSHVEQPLGEIVGRYLDEHIKNLDVDVMIQTPSRFAAVHRCAKLPETYTGDIIRIYTDDVHPGYARLIKENNGDELQLNDLRKTISNDARHGPAILESYTKRVLTKTYSLTTSAGDLAKLKEMNETPFDMVHAVHSPYWPVEASEWITRRRSHDFPSKSVIKQVVRYGCDFVQVSHNRLSDEGEWRFSFSRAEYLIAKTWSIPHRIVYTTLWVLNKKIASSNLCTYYFKTLLFWACEEKPARFWRDELLVHSVCELLIEVMTLVKSKFCVNYFIPGNNMMDHLIDTNLSSEVNALWKSLQDRQLLDRILTTCWEHELMSDNLIYRIRSPAWMKRAFVIFERLYNAYDNYTDLFSTNLTEHLQKSLFEELSDIYIGLDLHKMSASCLNESDKHICVLKSEHHLLLAIIDQNQLLQSDVIDNCDERFYRSMSSLFICTANETLDENANKKAMLSVCSIEDHSMTLNGRHEQKCRLCNRREENYDCIDKCNNIDENNMIKAIGYYPGHVFKSMIYSYKAWPGRSPTVNISWFIAKAYLANLYYTTKVDLSLTVKACDDIIKVSKQSEMNAIFAEKSFPVVLSTQWTSIYDKEIQELLGFYSLCSHVFGKSSRSVYLGVCPVLFAHYLKVCAVRDALFSTRDANDMFDMTLVGVISNMTLMLMEYFNDHIDSCQCDMRVNNGLQLLAKAILRNLYHK